MTAEIVAAAADAWAFHPRGQFNQLALDHVAFDDLTGREAFESAALRDVTADTSAVAVVGPIGAGKSSLIAAVCGRLPESHVALRVPVTGADDPTHVSTLAALALSSALSAVEMDHYQRSALERERADRVTQTHAPIGITGGRLGGGRFPAGVDVELGSLREEYQTQRLAGERLVGLDRLISILVSHERQPVFVLEDTEAAIGGANRTEVADQIFDGPIRAFMREVDAACLIAVQEHIAAQSASFQRLAPELRLVPLPTFDDAAGHLALAAIVDHRLSIHGLPGTSGDVVGDDAFQVLLAFYRETNRSIRHVLAALQSATEHAADMGSALVRAPHVHAAAEDWRPRLQDHPGAR